MINNVFNDGGNTPIKFNPQQMKYNSQGIPVLSAREIESIANEMLLLYCPHVFNQPTATPVVEIIEQLGKRTGLMFAMEDLGYKGTAKILGKVSFHLKKLFLDSSLQSEREAAFRFTAAHEIGHWVLHRYNYKKWELEADKSLQDDERNLCRLENRTQSDWLEFQANVFAASLVMPREMFITALKQIQVQIGIIKNLGRIYASNAPSSHRDCETIINQLSYVFKISKQSARVRTKTLQLVEGEYQEQNKDWRINPFTVLASLKN